MDVIRQDLLFALRVLRKDRASHDSFREDALCESSDALGSERHARRKRCASPHE